MIATLKRWKRKQDFNPDILGMIINPFYIARRTLYKGIRAYAGSITGKVLDVGCGRKPYRELFHCDTYIGMDIEQSGHSHVNEQIDVFYDGNIFPFEDKSFDNILTNQVFEHVFNPEQFMSEISRVVKPNGHLLITVPFVWDEHEQPYDFARYSSFGLTSILKRHGFEIVSYTKSANNFSVIAQLTVLFFYKKLYSRKYFYYNTAMIVLLLSPITIAGVILSKILPNSIDLYLDNIVLARKTK
ncbi:MAG TPA: class I SAM-dependent methyltransferase [Cyclobacteriaceae bacterium]|nr:class I SAM-dependent methyltransferase [Cyclobacteriaceae bacterium]